MFPRTLRRCLHLFAAFSALYPAFASAFTLNRNAANIRWQTVETEHFRFHYPRELEEVTGEIAGIAEAVAPVIIKRYNAPLPNKVEFIVRDDIFSNGWANSLQNTMTVWSTDWDFPVRSTHNWLRDVVTHEFAHLVSIQSGAKLPAFLQGVVIGYDDYYNAPVQGSFSTIIPFINQPAWFAEGVAQYESERAGFDAWDSHRDMLLRVAALENKLLPIERMDVFAGKGIEYELGPYTQGFGLTRFIAARYGDDALIRLWAENSRIHRQTLSGAMERVLGKSDREVHEEWKNELTQRYSEQVRALGTQVYGKKLTSKGYYNYHPHWDAQGTGLFFLSNAGSESFRATIGHVKLADTTKSEDDRFTAIPGARGYFDVAADDSTFLFSSAKDPDPNGMPTLDVFQRNLRRKAGLFERKDPTKKRFTRNFNAVHASYSPDGKRITFVRGGASNFRLYVAPVPEGDSLEPDEARAIFPPEDSLAGRFGFNIYSPKFSPDGTRILFSYFNGETRNIGIINADGTGFRPVLSAPHDERDPEWAPDGKSFYFSSDETGIYNIYRHDFGPGGTDETGKDTRVTNVAGGAFTPAISPDGGKLAYVNYDKDGFSIYLLEGLNDSAARATTPPPLPVAVRDPRPQPPYIEPLDFSGRGEDYTPVPTRGVLTPIIFGQEAIASTRAKGVIPEDGETKWLAGASGYLADPVLKNELSGALLAEIGNGYKYFGNHSALVSPDKESQLFIALANHATPVTLGASFFRGNLNSYDTILTRDINSNGDSAKSRQNYALTFRGVEASAAYDLFDATTVGEADKSSLLRVAAGYGWNDFNFYDLGGGQGFSFTYFQRLYLTTTLVLRGSDYNDKGLVAPSGFAAVFSHTLSRNNLFGCESDYTSDCFKFENGVATPEYKHYTLQDADAGFTYGTPMPWAKNSALVTSIFSSSVFGLPTRNHVAAGFDSTADFFEKGLMIRGYPYLRDVENLALRGENTMTLSADLNQPLIPDLYKRYWVVFVEDLYVNAFWEAGRAWNGSAFQTGIASPSAWKIDNRQDGWFQSLGVGLKVNARIYHNYPFLAYLEGARALSGLPDGSGGFLKLDPVRFAGSDLPFTRVRFGVTFGLYNGLLGRSGVPSLPAARSPLNPVSPFAARL